MSTRTKRVKDKQDEGKGLRFERFFTPEGSKAYDLVKWNRVDARIDGSGGKIVFEQKEVEFPQNWSPVAINVVSQKYFHGQLDTPKRETSLKQLVGRIVDTIKKWGLEGHYFASEMDADNWAEELRFLLISQYASFNSPVWFNIGVPGRAQQASACFINSVEDSMESIMELAKTEAMLFKFGSGTGTNLSVLRGSQERLSGGGYSSGPVSFMRGYDAFAGSIKSGGTTRRAAKMVILNSDHPDIEEFIKCKAEEEKKAWALIEAGYEAGFNIPGGAYDSVQFQNANHSVRMTDEFLRAVEQDGDWTTHAVADGREIKTYKARQLWKEIAESAWICGDPGLQFDSIIQKWNCVPNTGRINATNPCAEFVFLDDTACNLLSLNLMKYRTKDGEFDPERFKRAIDICFTAQEILVSNASYPTPLIARNSEALRPLGLGYANLGALLMSMGLAYDSGKGQAMASAITSLMTGEAYVQSARMAEIKGPFTEFEKNKKQMLGVMNMHRHATYQLPLEDSAEAKVVKEARSSWDEAIKLGQENGYRNAQSTVLAPTGTIGLQMDCDTTGIEPDLALVKYKRLVGGGMFKIVNQTVPEALTRLGYDERQVKEIVEYIDTHDTIEGAPELKDEHLSVFDCAFKPAKGERSIVPMGHVRMMAAVQPFISGSQSKTVNLPHNATIEDIQQTYMESWKLGLKCIAVYRDGCKRSQPLSTESEKDENKRKGVIEKIVEVARPVRRRLPAERPALTHKFDVAGHEGYITVGLYEDGKVGEIFLIMAKEGSTISGLMDAFATQTSLALQYGVPLEMMVAKFARMRFDPSGYTQNPEIRMAQSIIDYIFRWLASRFLDVSVQETLGIHRITAESETGLPAVSALLPPTPAPISARAPEPALAPPSGSGSFFQNPSDAPLCPDCGIACIPSGACAVCPQCGTTTGCS